MTWLRSARLHLDLKTSQVIQLTWLVFTVLAIGLAIAGIPHYLSFLSTPCAIPDCTGLQMTEASAEGWVASGVDLSFYATIQLIVQLIISTLMVLTAVYLIMRKSHHPAGILTAFVGVALAASTLALAQARVDPRFAFPAQLILFVQMAGLLPILCLFPYGNFQPRWMRWIALGNILLCLVYLFPQYRVWLVPGSPYYLPWLAGMLLTALVGLINLVIQLRQAAGSPQYEQMIWILAGMVLALPIALLGAPIGLFNASIVSAAFVETGPAGILFGLLFALGSFTCILVALVNYEPLDSRGILRHTLLFALLTAFIVIAYGLIVGYLSNVFHSENALFSLIATGLIAILFQPLRERLHGTVNRMVYGERDDPYQVLAHLGRRLETAIDPTLALALTVETTAQALKIPYAAIHFLRDGQIIPAAAFGTPQTPLVCFPLIYAGETMGEFLVGQRAEHEPFSAADRCLLEDLARQVSMTAHAALLSIELQSARLRIVEAREETRRRLGSDLHDGLGHQLIGLARKTEQAACQLESDPHAAAGLLLQVNQQINATITQVRSLAHQLHPPELEVLGLVDALREQFQFHPDLAIRLNVGGSIPPLPAAVETAAYYIVLEALNNIEKHAAAGSCQINLGVGIRDPIYLPALVLEITDDGTRQATQKAEGLGILSMQGRAAEVGGSCLIIPHSGGGTSVQVCLPFQSSAHKG